MLGGIWEIASCRTGRADAVGPARAIAADRPGCPAGATRDGARRLPGIGTRESVSMAARSRRDPSRRPWRAAISHIPIADCTYSVDVSEQASRLEHGMRIGTT